MFLQICICCLTLKHKLCGEIYIKWGIMLIKTKFSLIYKITSLSTQRKGWSTYEEEESALLVYLYNQFMGHTGLVQCWQKSTNVQMIISVNRVPSKPDDLDRYLFSCKITTVCTYFKTAQHYKIFFSVKMKLKFEM